VTKTLKIWDRDSIETLSGSFACTDWAVFSDACQDLDELTDTVTDYIRFCTENQIHEKKVKIFPNNKPWVTKELRAVTQKKHSVIKSSDKAALKAVQRELSSLITKCKADYRQKVEDQFKLGNSRSCWQGLKSISGHSKAKVPMPEGSEQEVANNLNIFYTRFEKPDDIPDVSVTEPPFQVEEEEVRKVLCSVKANKAQGPDNVSPRLLKHMASDLAPICTTLFNLSLEKMKVPKLWKKSTIVPVPKKARPKTDNDYRPVALTSVIMKCFEKLVLTRLLQQTEGQLDPLQFAYKKQRSTEDATVFVVHQVLQHLDTQGNYVRILFADFSSAFNTMRPSTLHRKLSVMGVKDSLCAWVLDYLRGRQQQVRVGSTLSDTRMTNIGAPQGCVISPVLFTIYTDNHRGQAPHTHNSKYADDAALVGLISNRDETQYRESVKVFAELCQADDLDLNITKTKELVIDFRRAPDPPITPLVINGSEVEIVLQYDYLGSRLCSSMCWTEHISKLIGKAMKGLYGLRKLREFGVSKKLLRLFYTSTVESSLTFGIVAWGGSLTHHDKRSLNRVRRCASRVVGESLEQWDKLYHARAIQLAHRIMADSSHPLHDEFTWLPSGRRLKKKLARTKRYKNSFVPMAIALITDK